MKTIKDYIKESILDDIDDVADDINLVQRFIDEHPRAFTSPYHKNLIIRDKQDKISCDTLNLDNYYWDTKELVIPPYINFKNLNQCTIDLKFQPWTASLFISLEEKIKSIKRLIIIVGDDTSKMQEIFDKVDVIQELLVVCYDWKAIEKMVWYKNNKVKEYSIYPVMDDNYSLHEENDKIDLRDIKGIRADKMLLPFSNNGWSWKDYFTSTGADPIVLSDENKKILDIFNKNNSIRTLVMTEPTRWSNGLMNGGGTRKAPIHVRNEFTIANVRGEYVCMNHKVKTPF